MTPPVVLQAVPLPPGIYQTHPADHPDVDPRPFCDPMPISVDVCHWDPKAAKTQPAAQCPEGYVIVHKTYTPPCPSVSWTFIPNWDPSHAR